MAERMVPEYYKNDLESYYIFLMHMKSYETILGEVKGKTVLDFGCGEGYGARILSQSAQQVTGIDISQEAIEQAKIKYTSPNVSFKYIRTPNDIITIFGKNSFDIVISYQVIEHIHDAMVYLEQIKKVLKPQGKLYLTTPNANFRLLFFQKPWNQFHVREYTYDSLQKTLKKVFTEVSIRGFTATEKLLAIEKKRVRRNKWILWPLTNYFVPEFLRQSSLSWIKKVVLNKNPSNSSNFDGLEKEDVYMTSVMKKTCPDFFAICC